MEKVTNTALQDYLNSLAQYKTLTLEEEQELGKKLHDIKNNEFVFLNNDNIPIFDYKKLFNCLKNIELNKELLELLKKLINNFDYCNNKKILNKYIELVIKNNSFLNEEELNNYFKIDNNDIILNEQNIINNLNDIIEYLKARNKFINSNLLLVVNISFKYKSKNKEPLDIINDGNIGLIKAVDRFDITKGYKFSTYATFWIKREIRARINNNNPFVVKERTLKEITEFNKKVKELEEKNNKTYSYSELTKIFNLSYNTVVAYRNFVDEFLSLDKEISDDSTIYDVIAEDDNNFNELINEMAYKKIINEMFECLTDKEKEILSLRYGLNTKDNKCYTIYELSKVYNVSHQRIQQIESESINKIKRKKYNLYIKSKNDLD